MAKNWHIGAAHCIFVISDIVWITTLGKNYWVGSWKERALWVVEILHVSGWWWWRNLQWLYWYHSLRFSISLIYANKLWVTRRGCACFIIVIISKKLCYLSWFLIVLLDWIKAAEAFETMALFTFLPAIICTALYAFVPDYEGDVKIMGAALASSGVTGPCLVTLVLHVTNHSLKKC